MTIRSAPLRAAAVSLLAIAFPIARSRAQAPAPATTFTVRGTAWDSLRNEPLAGAVIAGAGRTTLSDPRGRFQLDSVPAGTHNFTMSHDALDALGLSGVTSKIEVGTGHTDIRLAVPSFATFWRSSCTGQPPRDSVYVYGVVRTAGAGTPVSGATVELAWLDVGATGKQVTQTPRSVRMNTDGTGGFAFCGAPPGTLRIRATTAGAASGIIDVLPGTARIGWRDLTVGTTTGPAQLGAVAGIVLRAEGAPLVDARIVMDGVPESRTDTLGAFALGGVPAGTRQYQVRAVGLTPVTQVVDVAPGEPVRVTVNMDKVTTLDAALVTGTPMTRRFVAAIEERKSLGLGRFIDSTDIRGKQMMRSVFEEMPFVQFNNTRRQPTIFLRDGCVARVFIDNVDQMGQETLWMMNPDEIALVEFYPKGGPIPVEFTGFRTQSACAIAVWTKRAIRP